jgi:hypothetical protein
MPVRPNLNLHSRVPRQLTLVMPSPDKLSAWSAAMSAFDP